MERESQELVDELRANGTEVYSFSRLDCINNCLYEAYSNSLGIIRLVLPRLFLTVVNLLALNDFRGRVDLPKRSFFCVKLLALAFAHLVSRDKSLHVHPLLSAFQYNQWNPKMQHISNLIDSGPYQRIWAEVTKQRTERLCRCPCKHRRNIYFDCLLGRFTLKPHMPQARRRFV